MDLSDNSWDSEICTRRRNAKHILSKNSKKYYSRNFLKSWMRTFDPWITRDPDDPNKPYCKVCKSSLNCNTCHLKRHARTTKHKVNLETAMNGGDDNSLKNRFASFQDEKKQELQEKIQSNELESSGNSLIDESSDHLTIKETDVKYQEENDLADFQFVTTDSLYCENKNERKSSLVSTKSKAANVSTTKKSTNKSNDRMTLLKRIQRDRTDLFDSYANVFSQNDRYRRSAPEPQKEKDHVDLFFESVVLSVKGLSPKLIAEAKLRVSQMIGELELREITANEAATSKLILDSSPNVASTQNEVVSSVSSYYINHPDVVYVENNQEETPTQSLITHETQS